MFNVSTTRRIARTFSLFVFLLLPICAAVGQKNTNKPRADAHRQKFKNAKVSAYDFITRYIFETKGEQLQVACTEEVSMIALEGNVTYKRPVFYNDQLSIVSTDIRYTNGKTVPSEKLCGNYEVEDIFYSDAKVCVHKFNFLYEGTEVLFKTKMLYADPRYLTRVFFHDEMGIENRTLVFSIPKTTTVELVEKNFSGYAVEKSVTEEGDRTVYTYRLKECKAMKTESNSLGMLYYYPHLIVVTKEYTIPSGKRTVLSSVNDLYRWYSSLVKDVKNDAAPFQEEVTRLTASAKTPEEKIKAIYYWVQDNIRYIAFEDGIAGFKPEAAQRVYTNRYGDCKGMANLTKEMLRAAGFDARLAWIGTNRIPYSYDLPSLAVDNHMICCVYVGDKQYILDPTEKFIALGKHAERIQGKEMLIENGETYTLKKVPVATAEQNLVTQNETITIEGDILKGQGQITVNGEARKNILYLSTQSKQEDQKRLYDRLAVAEYSNTDQVEVTQTPSMDRDKPLEMKYSYSLNNKVTRFGKDLYVDVDWNKSFKTTRMDADRESDYYFTRKVSSKTVKKLKIPAGYKVTHVPANLVKRHDDFSFVVTFEQKGGELIYTNEIQVKNGLVKKTDFDTWNAVIKDLNELYNDQIVLTKIK